MTTPDWLTQLHAARADGAPLLIPEAPLPGAGTVLALAPHPDDPDAIGVTLRLLQQGGWDVHWAILNSGWSGVLDDFVGPNPRAKGEAREAEERAAARHFGLPDDCLRFLYLREDAHGVMDAGENNYRRFAALLDELQPDLVFLPHGADTNPDHRLTYTWFLRWAHTSAKLCLALGNEDPKSVAFTPDLLVTFGEETAHWKADLLECHRSQSVRNQLTRGHTFAERILAVNRAGMAAGEYAERFPVPFFKGHR